MPTNHTIEAAFVVTPNDQQESAAKANQRQHAINSRVVELLREAYAPFLDPTAAEVHAQAIFMAMCLVPAFVDQATKEVDG